MVLLQLNEPFVHGMEELNVAELLRMWMMKGKIQHGSAGLSNPAVAAASAVLQHLDLSKKISQFQIVYQRI